MNWLKSFWKARSMPPAREGGELVEAANNFTPRAQQVLALARKEADRFHHSFVGTEHLLLGLISLGQGTAVTVIRRMGLDLETVRLEVKKQVRMGTEAPPDPIPYTPRVMRVFTLAAKEARTLHHTYVGTEHILLGLLREGDGVAGRVLKSLELDTDATRQNILRELDPNYSPAMSQKPEPPKSQHVPIDVSRRYDVYCQEGDKEVIYRNALFKGVKTLLQKHEYHVLSEYLELEQADGQTIFIARSSVIKFCEHGATPGSETISGEKP